MSGPHSRQEPHLTCDECQQQLQEYHDGTLARAQSMRVFLHLRDCDGCQAELDRLQRLIGALETLPSREPPADLDQRILASIPYEQYRAMAALRAPRVPVFLEAEALPAWLRARAVQGTGAAVAAAALGARFADLAPDAVLIVAAVGLVPAVTVGLQAVARRLVAGARQVREES